MKLSSFTKKLLSTLLIVVIYAFFSTSYGQITVQYTYTGSVQSFTVPTCVTSIQVKAWGAGGSGGGTDTYPGAVGGAGAFVQSTFAVTAGQTFTIVVGGGAGPGQGCLTCAPGGTSGWGNGVIDGGTGGNAGCSGCSGGGGGGGGGSGLYNGATPWLVVGGGGGGSGGGQFSSGAVGGAGGVNGGTVAGSCASPGIAGASANGIGGAGLNKGGGDGGGGGGGGGGSNGGTGGGVAGGCDCGACGGGGGNGFASGTGTIITNGAGQVPGNSGDPSLPAGDAVGGGTSTQGGNGFLIITYSVTTPVITLPPTTTICSGSSATLTASGATTYSWSTGASTNSITVSPITNTTYTVTGTTTTGCTATATTTVVVAPSLNVTITPSAPTICLGSSTTLVGNGAATYSWSDGETTNSITVSPTTATSYTVTGTSGGCTGTASATVTVDLLKASAAGFPATCAGVCNGYTEVIPTAGTLPYTYSWTPSGNITANANNLCAGNYCIKVSDANGCSVDTCVTVSEPPAMNVSIASSTNDSCYGECDGTATSLTTGGTTPYTYSWNSVPAQTTANATGLCAGTYKVTVTDANGCSNSASVTITQPTQLAVTPSAATTICIGQGITLNATANGGTSAYTYSWNNTYNGQNYTVSPVTSPTTYTVVATDANGCLSAPETVVITINPPLSVVAKNDTSLCIGGHATLSAQGSGGDGTYNYVWQPGSISGSLISVTPATTTVYTVTVTDNCSSPADSAKVTITINPLPSVSFSADTTNGCYPLCVTFTNSSTPSSASATWEFGDGNTANSVTTATNCYQNSGLFTVQLSVTDDFGCTNSASAFDMINVFPHPTANFGTAPNPISIIEPTVYFQDLSTGSVNQWEWSLGDVPNSNTNVQNPTYSYQDTGYYNVQLIVIDNNGCTDSITKTIYVEGQYVIYVPNAFTPNGDGINDVFYPKGTGIDAANFDMSIYDRWGNLIFHTTNLNQGWNGRVNNNLVQLGVYVWKIETKDFKGDDHQYIGHVSVIR